MLLFNYSEESEREACYKDNEERGDAMKYLLTKCEDGGLTEDVGLFALHQCCLQGFNEKAQMKPSVFRQQNVFS